MDVPHLTRWQARRRKWKKLNGYMVTVLFIVLAVTAVGIFGAFFRTVAPAFVQ